MTRPARQITLGTSSARIGYAFTPAGLGVRICTRCPDRAQAERAARQQGLVIIRTVCPACFQKQLTRRFP